MNPLKAYIVVMTFELTCVGIKYGISNTTNPFQQSTPTPSPTVLLFLAALFPHVIASMLDMTNKTTIITFHVSGVVGCEALLHIFLGNFFWYCIGNLFLLLLILSFCFFDYVSHLLGCLFNRITNAAPSNALPMPNMEPHRPHPPQLPVLGCLLEPGTELVMSLIKLFATKYLIYGPMDMPLTTLYAHTCLTGLNSS
ncbi:hypothetical protein Fmac_014119 [Flemingia macrophylla]|uniref:Uncharacterized protein n=1 Tax=Flemingia macrophylla TaxID=520843 RepID=A0ABD1MAS6_9FABA